MKLFFSLGYLIIAFSLESVGINNPQVDPVSINPIIIGKSKVYVLIPGKDSVLFSVANVQVANWRIRNAPSHGIATLSGADSHQVWLKYERTFGKYRIDTLTLEATRTDGALSAKDVYLTSYDNVYQYEGEMLMDKIRLDFYNSSSGIYAETIKADGSFIQGICYLWPASHLMRAFKNANRINPLKYGAVLKNFTNSMERYKSTANNKIGYAAYPGESGRFYDDNGLLIIQFAEIYKDLKNRNILKQAEIAYHFNNADRDVNFGLPQHENQLGQGIFYSMAVTQTGLGAALLYELTGTAA
jgi:hypothetical protein